MKNFKKFAFKVLCLVSVTICLLLSCNDDYLEEIPKSFLTPENTYINKEGFETAINELYRISRMFVNAETLPGMVADATTGSDFSSLAMNGGGVDIGYFYGDKAWTNYDIINSENREAQNWWVKSYTLIKDANVILSRMESINWDVEDDKLLIKAQARFFRAFAYRYLVYLFGDVPIVTDELTEPKIDFTRAPKEDVLDLMISDLEFASNNLPVTNDKDGRIVKAAADHLLAETYISKGDFDKSIEAASRIINDTQYQLMTERFGTMANWSGKVFSSPDPWLGDVFWDLFRTGNQNNPANKETIWAWQNTYNVIGAVPMKLIRLWAPFLEKLKTPDGKAAFLLNEYMGRPAGVCVLNDYTKYYIWQSDWNNDIRNSKYNMQREFYPNNPQSAYYGQLYTLSPKTPSDTIRNFHVWIWKAGQPEGYPQGYDSGGNQYVDFYAIRLAETYLLRAEAYLRKGNMTEAADDINVVRNRANATPVDPSHVDIDYILDERARELVIEEPRRLTLARLGLVYERTIRYNPISGATVKEFHNLWPIPQTEIDANSGVQLLQNPGY